MASEFFSEVGGDSELEGYSIVQGRKREGAVLSAVNLINDVKSGRVPSYLLQEALAPRTPGVVGMIGRNYPGIVNVRESMTTSDFPNLLANAMGRILLARFAAYPATWKSFVDIAPDRRDMRTMAALSFQGLEGAFEVVGEGAEFPYGAMTETPYSYSIKKFVKGARVSWELLLSDDLGAFDTIPDRLARGAARTMARYVTGLYVGAAGPNGTFFSAGNGNIVTGNPVLSITALQTAWAQLRAMVDVDGEPIGPLENVLLVVPSGALEIVAKNILNTTQVLPVSTAGGPVIAGNWVASGITVIVDPYAGVIPTSNGATSWYLFAAPSQTSHPAIQVASLAGFREPQLFQKIANTSRIGGGIAQEMGDWSVMATEWKCMVAFGGSLLSPLGAVASNGTGS